MNIYRKRLTICIYKLLDPRHFKDRELKKSVGVVGGKSTYYYSSNYYLEKSLLH